MTALSDPTALVAELRAGTEHFSQGREPRRYTPPTDLHLRAAATIEAVTKERDEARGDLAREKSESARRLACMDRRADRIIDLTDALTAAEAERDRARQALKAAKGWLEGWASAERELAVIDAALSTAKERGDG